MSYRKISDIEIDTSFLDFNMKYYAKNTNLDIQIPYAAAEKISENVLNNTPNNASCIHNMSTTLLADITAYRNKTPTFKPDIRFRMQTSFEHAKMLCTPDSVRIARTMSPERALVLIRQRQNTCIANIKSGKCKCPYMRQNILSELMPDLYANTKGR